MESQTSRRPQSDGPIRLTNKTALALRRSARQARTLALWQAAATTVFMAIAAVLMGIRWLPAVPLMTALAVLIDAGFFIRGRAQYLSLTGEALCAEAAARSLRAESREKERRERARRDFDDAKEDVRRAVREAAEDIEEAEKIYASQNSENSENIVNSENSENTESTEDADGEGGAPAFPPLSGDTRALGRDELEALRAAGAKAPVMPKAAPAVSQVPPPLNIPAPPPPVIPASSGTPAAPEAPVPPRRRRRQASLTVLRAEDVK